MRVRGTTTSSEILWRAMAARGRRHLPARLPQAIALRRVLRGEHLDRAGVGADAADALHRRLARGDVAVDLDQEQRARPRVDAHAAGAHGVERGRVEQLDAAGDEAGRHDRLDRAARAGDVGEEPEQRRHRGRLGHEAERGLGGHGQRALAADEQRGDVVAGDALRGAPAGAEARAVHQEHLEAEHVVARRRRT